MFDFDPDEFVFFGAAAALTVFGIVRYFRPIFSISTMGRSPIRLMLLACLPLLAMLPACLVLQRWADAQVVGHPDYILLFLLGDGALLFAAMLILEILGISIRDDALERNNPAALLAACGWFLGVGIIYAMANIGGGPTLWTTLFPAWAGTGALVLAWLLIEILGGRVAESITIERDVAGALRLAGAAVGCALILGRAAAGNFLSWDQTWIDFAQYGWPAAIIAIAAGITHRILRPSADSRKPVAFTFGLLPAAVFIFMGLFVVAINKHGLHPSQW